MRKSSKKRDDEERKKKKKWGNLTVTLLIRKAFVHKEEGTCTEILLILLPTASVNPGIL